MKSIAIGIDPVIVQIGTFELRWYGLMIMAAVLVGIWVASIEGKRRGVSIDDVYSIGLWGVIGGILGARLFHVLDKWEYYLANPMQILAFQQGGLAIWGGVAGGALGGLLYARRRKLSLPDIMDIGALGLIAGQIVGRFGCIINGDATGAPTTLPWGVRYIHPNALLPQALIDYAREEGISVTQIATHPYPVYEMLWNLAVLGILWKLRTRTKVSGALFFAYIALYSVGRFLLSYVRMEDQYILGLQQAQVIALGMAIIGVIAFVYLQRSRQPVPLGRHTA